MREDMFKVVVERPRRCGLPDGARQFRNDEETPSKIGIRRGYTARKTLNENLAPLRRFLESQVGRPWNSVYGEMRKTIDGRSTVKQHILLHVEDFVAIHTRVVNGVIVANQRWSGNDTPLADLWQTLYVDPDTGYLMRNTARVTYRQRQREAEAKRKREEAQRRRVLDARCQLHCIDGLWFLVELAELPAPREEVQCTNGESQVRKLLEPRWDMLQKRWVALRYDPQRRSSMRDEQSLYGDPTVYAVNKRQLSRLEVRRYCLT